MGIGEPPALGIFAAAAILVTEVEVGGGVDLGFPISWEAGFDKPLGVVI